MTTNNNLTAQKGLTSLMATMITGAAIALVLIIAFLWTAGEPDPAWSKFWRLRPLLIAPIAGALGSLVFYLSAGFRKQGGLKKIVAIFLSGVAYIFALWMGTVLGLAGTYWH